MLQDLLKITPILLQTIKKRLYLYQIRQFKHDNRAKTHPFFINLEESKTA